MPLSTATCTGSSASSTVSPIVGTVKATVEAPAATVTLLVPALSGSTMAASAVTSRLIVKSAETGCPAFVAVTVKAAAVPSVTDDASAAMVTVGWVVTLNTGDSP